MIPLLTAEQARAFDASWIARGVPGLVLMENAGRGAAQVAVRRLLHGDARDKRVVVVCGRGNNGGDGFVVARRLHTLGASVRVVLLGGERTLGGDAATQAAAYRALGLPIAPWGAQELGAADLIVDALFGTGLTRALEGPERDAVLAINVHGAPVCSLDLPSGLDADTGVVRGGVCVHAALTVTFGFPKMGLYTPRAREVAGEVVVVDIGVPADLPDTQEPAAYLLERSDVEAALTPRRSGAHKNANGHVLIVGGSAGKTGAPQLSAYGALRAGAGLVTVATWAESMSSLANLPISVMRAALDPDDLGASLSLATMRAVVVGPGLGTGADAAQVFAYLASPAFAGPLVFDADAFTWAQNTSQRFRRQGATVITPHPAELARVLGVNTSAVEADRFAAASDAAMATGAVVVLKGAHTIVAAPGESPLVSPFAEPSLGVAGSGDTLAGIVGALLGAGHEAREAAWLGVWLHAEAGRSVARARGHTDRGILPTEVADALPPLFSTRPPRKGRAHSRR